MRYSSLSLIFLTLFLGCVRNHICEEVKDINFSNNEFLAEFISSSDDISVGDTMIACINLPNQLKDFNGDTYMFDAEPQFLIRFSEQDANVPFDSTNFFSLGGESLHEEFENHFETNVIYGERDNTLAFYFFSALIENSYQLLIEFVAKKAGIYRVDIFCNDNELRVDGYNEVCDDIVAPVIVWEDSQLNVVEEYYDEKEGIQNTFVFEVD